MPLTWCFQFHAHFVFQPFMSCYFGKQCPCYLFSTIPSIPYILVLNVLSLSRVLLFVTPWTVAHQAPPSMGFSRQEYWLLLLSRFSHVWLCYPIDGSPVLLPSPNACLALSNLCSLGMAVSSVPGVLQTPYDSWYLSRALCLIPGQAFQLLLTFNLCSNARLLFQSVWALFWRNSIADRILKRFTVKPKLIFICTLIGYKDFNFWKHF